MVQESVGVSWFRSKSRRGNKFYNREEEKELAFIIITLLTGIDFGLESLSHFVHAISYRAGPLSVLVELVLVWHKVGHVELALRHLNLPAHARTELILERRQVDETIAVGVKHILHEERDVALRGKDLILKQICLKVFVGDETITVHIERSEDLESTRLARTEMNTLDLAEDAAEPARRGLVLDRFATFRCSCLQLFIDIGWRWVSALIAGDSQGKLVGVLFEHERGDSRNVSSAMHVVFE